MNIKQLESNKNSTLRLSTQSRPNRLILMITFLLVTSGTGYFIWRKLQLNATQELIRNCVAHQDCADNTEALEKLVKANKSLKLLNLPNANLENANLENAHLDSANLENTHLEHAHLEHAHLENANLAITHLENAHLEHAHLENANLSNAHLEGANLQGANLEGAYVSHDNLEGASLNRANLQGVHLYHANFEETNFYRANLSQSSFYKANFAQSNLYGANLQGAYLVDVQNLTPAQIKSACHWKQAIYKAVWSAPKSKWVVDEKANHQFIQQLQEDQESEPKKPIDCRQW